ncbi:glycosyltransferase family 9 protein [Saccharothrix algeriensis]|uniref:ADP-heptose:LPS heptosyltransferase n=1 Tax=Saccharothrix algeriensis TaxID=173560 RepID=A0A8T8I0Z5_9PSEU|nr:glycosyltransferase family 9 protein [Saccharothrix algeriensis]MBM7810120.1 ADP-heptose:LPS heptosyltransferase [Saccharothrix algeriensis]QTR04328.1 glycosyltransferase family 9 protein [Saccharothrix algeriensis]
MRILVLRALGLGDLLTAVPALRGLRRAHPDAEIALAAPAWLADAVERVEAVDRLLPTEGLAPVDFPRPDLAVNLHGRGPQSTDLLRVTGPERLIAHGTHVPWRDDQHEVDRWCRLLMLHGIPCDPDDLHLPRPERTTGDVVVHPGASHGARRWPVERFRAVVRELGPAAVVTGSPAEADLVRAVADGRARTSLGSLASLLDLIAGARAVLCGDTGAAHVATAYRTPSVLLFGPVAPDRWGPRSGPHRVLWHGSTGDTFADRPDPGLLRITVGEVLDAMGGVPWPGSVSSARATSV